MRSPDSVSRLRLALMRLARRLRQQADPGVSPSMLSALASIERLGPVALGDLAAAERVQPPSITAAAARLEEAGLIRREPDPTDRRVVRVLLSPAGEDFLARTRTRKDAYLARRLRTLSADERAALERAIPVLERLLDEEPR